MELNDGIPKSFFIKVGFIRLLSFSLTLYLGSFRIKVTMGDRGRSMVEGELASMRAIYELDLHICPVPIACGTYKSDPSLHFFLCSFQNFTEEVPETLLFYEKIAQMHLKSNSPTGKYGFYVTTHNGNLPRFNAWNDSWEGFFSKSFEKVLELESVTQGPSKEIEELRGPFFEKVIPRLLRPLESDRIRGTKHQAFASSRRSLVRKCVDEHQDKSAHGVRCVLLLRP